MEGLGRLFDIGVGWSPVDLNTANGATGKRISMTMFDALTIVVIKAAGTAADDFGYTLKQHTAYTSGTSADLVAIDHYYLKDETALDGDERWVKHTQTLAATITEAGAAGTSAEHEQILVVEVAAATLTEGYTHVSFDAAATVGNAQLATCIYLPHELRRQTKPTSLLNLLRPNVANA